MLLSKGKENKEEPKLIKKEETRFIPLSLIWDRSTIPGLKMKYIPDYTEGTMFLCVAEADTLMDSHQHEQQEEIIVVAGDVNVTTSKQLKHNNNYTIKSNTVHQVAISKGAIFHVVFKPRL